MITSYEAASGIDVLTSTFPVPGFGVVPINAFVLHGAEPVLVDTGPVVEREEFMAALGSVIDPADLRWIWLTHTDFDHIGALPQLLAENPQLRILTTFLSVGIMSLSAPLPLDRVHLINPGQKLTVGDRTLTAVKPPVFDNPATTGFHDDRSGALFSSDCFGALLQAAPENAADLSDQELREGQVFWATLDSPWLHKGGTVEGAGISVGPFGTLTVNSSAVRGNTGSASAGTAMGGGIANLLGGTVTTKQSTISNNAASAPGGTAQGGGIFHAVGSTTLNRSAVTGNSAGDGGGIYKASGTVTLSDSVVRTNAPNNCSPPGSISGCVG